MDSRIIDAIRNLKIITFYYDGYRREVEPYTYGESTAGNDVLRGYQVGGQSKSGSPPDWRLYKTDELTNLTVTDKTFTKRSGYNRSDPAFARFYQQA